MKAYYIVTRPEVYPDGDCVHILIVEDADPRLLQRGWHECPQFVLDIYEVELAVLDAAAKLNGEATIPYIGWRFVTEDYYGLGVAYSLGLKEGVLEYREMAA